MSLNTYHRRMLTAESAIANEVITARKYQSVERDSPDTPTSAQMLKNLGIPRWARAESAQYPGLLIPLYGPTGQRVSVQYRPDKAVKDPESGKYRRYASPVGQASVLDVNPLVTRHVVDPAVPLWITEGAKKADALVSASLAAQSPLCVVSLSGVWNWRASHGTLGAWEDVLLKGRGVVICFDADAASNRNIMRAMIRLGRWLKSKQVATVWYLVVPAEVNGKAVKGADDYLAAGGNLAGLVAAMTTDEPRPDADDGFFTDARLAEIVADDVLAERFCWVKGLGWLGWDGRRWAEASDRAVVEEVRQWAWGRFNEVVTALRSKPGADTRLVDQWRTVLSAGRLRSLVGLAAGIVERTADAFDAYPDLLNTPDGVVHLPTGALWPANPALLLTKITRGRYRPGYTHPDWQQALTALPEQERRWLQARYGQAATGHPSPDDLVVVEQGGGENGKGVLGTDGVVPALGDYASVASPKLVSYHRKGNEHATEMADLRGRRLLIGEELAEGNSLDITVLKRITGVGRIKARFIAKDNIEFDATHTLFLTTNYVPVVSEVDHGTWRRLALLRFPYTFQKRPEDVLRDTDRLGDPGLKGRIKQNASGQHDAIVTWVVEGAMRWYRDAAVALLPTSAVETDTRAWRSQTDRVLALWDTVLVADPGACIPTDDLLTAYNSVNATGYATSRETFNPRFAGHAETTRRGVRQGRPVLVKGGRPAPSAPAVSRWHGLGGAPSPVVPLSNRPTAWLGVRFRTDADSTEGDDAQGGAEVGVVDGALSTAGGAVTSDGGALCQGWQGSSVDTYSRKEVQITGTPLPSLTQPWSAPVPAIAVPSTPPTTSAPAVSLPTATARYAQVLPHLPTCPAPRGTGPCVCW